MKLEEFLNGENVETYFDKKLKECKNYDKLPRELKNCTCCERHKINFPVLGQRLVSKEYTPNNSNKGGCKCPCRHIARHICREWDLIHEVEELSSEDSSESDSEDSSESDSAGSLEDFIVQDYGFNKKERKELDRALDKFRGKKNFRG